MTKTGKRIIAYFIDVIAIGLIAGFLAETPMNPNYDKQLELNEDYQEKYSEFVDNLNDVDSSDTEATDEYVNEFYTYLRSYSKKSTKLAVYENGILIICMILYYSVFAYFFDGETVGKRFMKLRVVDKNGGKASIWKLVVRTVFLFGILFTMLDTIFAFVLSKSVFMYVHMALSSASSIFSIVLLVMIFKNKENRGLHDLIAGTKVESR